MAYRAPGPLDASTSSLELIGASSTYGLCAALWNLGVEIRGRTAPFELYFVVGDPDSRTGLVFVRT